MRVLKAASVSEPDEALKKSPVVLAVLHWLEGRGDSNSEWLVVVDNADDHTWGIRDVVPKGRRGSVVITSQNNEANKLFGKPSESLRVDTMEPSEASSLLLQRLGKDASSASEDIQEIASEIVTRLGHLALAVDLAGAYIAADADGSDDSDRETALRAYLRSYERHQDELLRYSLPPGLSDYNKIVWTVWETTLEAIERWYPSSNPTLLLTLLAYMDPGNIQDELFRLGSLGAPAMAEDEHLGHVYQTLPVLPDWLSNLMTRAGEVQWDGFNYEGTQALTQLRYPAAYIRRVARGDYAWVSPMASTAAWKGGAMEPLVPGLHHGCIVPAS